MGNAADVKEAVDRVEKFAAENNITAEAAGEVLREADAKRAAHKRKAAELKKAEEEVEDGTSAAAQMAASIVKIGADQARSDRAAERAAVRGAAAAGHGYRTGGGSADAEGDGAAKDDAGTEAGGAAASASKKRRLEGGGSASGGGSAAPHPPMRAQMSSGSTEVVDVLKHMLCEGDDCEAVAEFLQSIPAPRLLNILRALLLTPSA